jgi:Domain of unknown function (DUF4114)
MKNRRGNPFNRHPLAAGMPAMTNPKGPSGCLLETQPAAPATGIRRTTLFRRALPAVLGCLLTVTAAMPASGETSPIQSPARPFGLDIVGPVQTAGSDTDAARFQSDYLPTVTDWVNVNLGEKNAIDSTASISLDPAKLQLATASDVRVYFVGEGAGYHNTLGFNTGGGGIDTGDPRLIFPDASSNVSYWNDTDGTGTRSSGAPLLPGDFVDLGTQAAGTQLDFFLIANGASGGSYVYSTDASVNPDGIDHVVAYALADSPYLLIGFEDLYGGGDRDFNDLLFAVDIGSVNVETLTNAPEPSTLVILGSFLGPVAYLRRRQRRHLSKETHP